MSMQGLHELQTVLSRMLQVQVNGELKMREKGTSGTLKNVTLTGLNLDDVTLKGDQSKITFFKKGYAGSCCDYIVLTTSQDKCVAVFIELKTTVPESDHNATHPTIQYDGRYEHYVEQLSGGSCLFSYLDNVLEIFMGCTALQKYQRYYCVLYENVQAPPTALSLPITKTITKTLIPDSNPATKAKLIQVQNGCKISLKELLK